MKYIIVEYGGCEVPILFDDIIEHCKMADAWEKVISAGECQIIATNQRNETLSTVTNEFNIQAYGKSVSLNLNSRPDDAMIIYDFVVRTLR